ncbi:MAG: DNA-directed RNA polymerase subunit omega [Candidatus Omnitrophota bacterium]|nr:DNA-directed RNA polymerase subunit omega [Candidatus Omnitrophota bacterium]
MSYMAREGIFKDSDSIYKTTILAARRAIELSNGSKRLVESASAKFSTIALEEISQGKVRYQEKTKSAA